MHNYICMVIQWRSDDFRAPPQTTCLGLWPRGYGDYFLVGPWRAPSASRAPPRSRGLRGPRYATVVITLSGLNRVRFVSKKSDPWKILCLSLTNALQICCKHVHCSCVPVLLEFGNIRCRVRNIIMRCILEQDDFRLLIVYLGSWKLKKRHVLKRTVCRLLIDALERPRRRKRRVLKKKSHSQCQSASGSKCCQTISNKCSGVFRIS